MKDVSVIIVNYNTSDLVIDCINSINARTAGIDYEIIVVDNDSRNDAHISKLQNLNCITYIQSNANLGFGKANNLGLTKATGKYIFFLNSDTILLNNAIKQLFDFYESYSGRLAALGTILEDRDGNRIHSYGMFPRIRDEFKTFLFIPVSKALRLYKHNKTIYPDTYMKVDYITGADLMVRKDILEEYGAFDPSFFMYYEETEMQKRFASQGFCSILISGPRIVHLEGESMKKITTSKFLRDTLLQESSINIYMKLTKTSYGYIAYRIIHFVVRQTLWLYPHISLSEKIMIFKSLTKKAQIQ